MRNVVIKALTEAARMDRDITILSADFGAPALDEFRHDLPDQFIHTGIAEQHMIDLAAGLALSGKKVFCYGMAPFLTTRCYEQIKCSLGAMNLPVTLIGVGVGFGYDNTSMTHICIEDIAVMGSINNLEILSPSDNALAKACIETCITQPQLRYLRLERHPMPPLYTPPQARACARYFGWAYPTWLDSELVSPKALIITSGAMTHTAIEAAEALWGFDRIMTRVIDITLIKPFPVLSNAFGKCEGPLKVVVVEEHLVNGGLGSAVVEYLARTYPQQSPRQATVVKLGLNDGFKLTHGDRRYLQHHFNIGVEAIRHAVCRLMGVDVTSG